MTDAREAAERIIVFNAMHGNGENDSIDEVYVARAYLALLEPPTEVDVERVAEAIRVVGRCDDHLPVAECGLCQDEGKTPYCCRAVARAAIAALRKE